MADCCPWAAESNPPTIVIARIWDNGLLRDARVVELAEEPLDFGLGDGGVKGLDARRHPEVYVIGFFTIS